MSLPVTMAFRISSAPPALIPVPPNLGITVGSAVHNVADVTDQNDVSPSFGSAIVGPIGGTSSMIFLLQMFPAGVVVGATGLATIASS